MEGITISDLWYQPLSKNEILIMIEYPDGQERSICDLEYRNHRKAPYEEVYNTCLEIAHEMGYRLEGEE